MLSYFYLRICSTKQNIIKLQEIINMDGARVHAIQHHADTWCWNMPYYSCSTLFPEDELEAFLEANQSLVEKLIAHRELANVVMATLVCKLDENERPNGFVISNKLMTKLVILGASFEIAMIANLKPMA
jgi:glycogen synthase